MGETSVSSEFLTSNPARMLFLITENSEKAQANWTVYQDWTLPGVLRDQGVEVDGKTYSLDPAFTLHTFA